MKRKVLYLMVCLMTIFFANAQVTSVAIVGEAVGGWPGDPGNPGPTDVHQMTSSDGVNWSITGLVVTNAATGGGVKFRANNSWDINWGSASFPTGTGTQGGANIVTIGNTYDVTFNSTTGEYNFAGGAPIPVVKLVGAATTADVSFITSDATIYTATNVTLLTGDAQFNVDNGGVVVLVGGTTFPDGTAEEGVSIPVTAGTYSTITFNYGDGSYSFTAAPVFNSVAIVGSGAGGWPTGAPGEIDANVLSTTDGISYTGNVALTGFDGNAGSGEIKFRENNAWVTSYGGVTFPTGPDTTNPGGNIVVPAGAGGYYYVTFDRSTGAYTFSIPSIAIVGSGVGGWPGDPGNPGPTDVNQLTTTDGLNYSISGLTVTNGEAKFRQNNGWDVNWGAANFPAGTGTQGGANIPTTAGTFDVTFNRMTGGFNFTVLATASFAKAGFKVYPNPTQNNWNFSSAKGNIQSVQIIDMLGKTIMSVTPADANATVDASSLNAGIYFAKIATATATETVKLVKN